MYQYLNFCVYILFYVIHDTFAYAWNGTYNFIVFIFFGIFFFIFLSLSGYMFCTTRYYYLFIRFSSPNSLFIHFVLSFCPSVGTVGLYSGYEAIICGYKLGKQYAMAVTEQEDLCRQNRKSFFFSSVSFFPSNIFSITLLMPLLPLSLSLRLHSHSFGVCVRMHICRFSISKRLRQLP